MSTLKLKVFNPNRTGHVYLLDGKEIYFKANKFGNYEYTLETDKETVDFEIKTINELQSDHWFWLWLLMHIISILGIFNPGYDKTCCSTDYQGKIYIGDDTNVEVKYNIFKINEEAVSISTNTKVDQITNRFYLNQECIKRAKTAKRLKLLSWLIAIVVIIYLIFMED